MTKEEIIKALKERIDLMSEDKLKALLNKTKEVTAEDIRESIRSGSKYIR